MDFLLVGDDVPRSDRGVFPGSLSAAGTGHLLVDQWIVPHDLMSFTPDFRDSPTPAPRLRASKTLRALPAAG
jgi:hypothetical protein